MERKDKFGEIKRRNILFFADETEFLRFADRVTQFRYGKITKKVVIYRGENTTLENGIEYKT